jgi:hypothetical protein
MAPNRPRLKLVPEYRLGSIEFKAENHEQRISDLETTMSQLLTVSNATYDMVSKLVPDVLELKKQSRAMRVAKKTGGAGLLLAIGGLLENYGPDIIRLIIGR